MLRNYELNRWVAVLYLVPAVFARIFRDLLPHRSSREMFPQIFASTDWDSLNSGFSIYSCKGTANLSGVCSAKLAR